jgi:hypothetical protein
MRIGYGTSITVPASTELWLSEVRAGRCFARGANLAASVGNFSEVQVFNPIASGKTIAIKAINFGSATAGSINIRTFNTALATLVGTGFNLQSGGAAGVGELRTATPAAEDGAFIGPIPAGAGSAVPVDLGWFIELDQGEGILCNHGTANTGITIFYLWREFVP